MNKYLLMLFCAACIVGFTSCSSEDSPIPELNEETESTETRTDSDNSDDYIIWDMAPVNVTINVVDNEGRNMLDPAVDGNWSNADFKVVFKGETYSVFVPEDKPESRYYLPTFVGLYKYAKYVPDETSVPVSLKFGEFDGEDDNDISIQFIVPEIDKSYEMNVKTKVIRSPKDREVIYEQWLDGENVEGTNFTIVLPAYPTEED